MVVVEDKVRKLDDRAAFVVSLREGLEEKARRRVRFITFARAAVSIEFNISVQAYLAPGYLA